MQGSGSASDTAFCFVTDGGDSELVRFASSELRRHIPDATVVIASDGGFSDPLPFHEVVDVRPEFERVFGRYRPQDRWTRFPPVCFARFVLPSVLDGRFRRIVYLDNDAIVVSPRFAEITEYGLGDCDLGACPDCDECPRRIESLKAKTGCAGIAQYCNSGVLLMRGTPSRRLESAVANGYREHARLGLTLPDQDVMNWKLKVARMDSRFNSMVTRHVTENTCCIHYSGGTKNWMIPLVRKGVLKWTFCS